MSSALYKVIRGKFLSLMQGQGSGIDTFSEITDVGLGPVSNSTGMKL